MRKAKRLGLDIDPKLHSAFKVYANKAGLTMSFIAEKWICDAVGLKMHVVGRRAPGGGRPETAKRPWLQRLYSWVCNRTFTGSYE